MKRTPATARRLVAVGWCLGLVATAVVVGMAVVGMTGLATGTDAPRGWEQLSEAFSVVNGVLSMFALVVVGVTLWVQFNELRMQRTELRMQREATELSQQELHRTSEAELRGLHVQLLEMAIDDPDLAEVWTEYRPDLPDVRRKQFLYANLILAHFNLIGGVAKRDEAYLPKVLGDAFQSPIMREFWMTVRDARREVRVAGTADWAFDEMCEAAYRRAISGPLHDD